MEGSTSFPILSMLVVVPVIGATPTSAAVIEPAAIGMEWFMP